MACLTRASGVGRRLDQAARDQRVEHGAGLVAGVDGEELRLGQKSRGRKFTIVSIISIGAGSVGDSARPALPTTMSTSGNRQRIMSHALRSSPASVTEARDTVIGMFITIPSSTGVMNSRLERRDHLVGATSADDDQAHPRQRAPEPCSHRGGRGDERQPERSQEQRRLPRGARPTTKRHPQQPDQRRGAVEQRREDRAVDVDHASHDPALALASHPSLEQVRAKRGDEGDGQTARP